MRQQPKNSFRFARFRTAPRRVAPHRTVPFSAKCAGPAVYSTETHYRIKFQSNELREILNFRYKV